MSPIEFARWLPNYVRSFGLLAGTGLFLNAARLSAGGGEAARPLRVPGLARPVWLRPGLHDLAILKQVFVKREYDIGRAPQFRRVEEAYRDMLARGERPLIIDCGAHVGLSALWFRLAFPEARIFAVEPSPANFVTLRRNLDGIEGITLFQGGIWNTPGRLRLTNAEGGMTGFRLAPAGAEGAGDVAAITVEEILERTGCDRALIVKIDIEGGEAALFEDGAPWLDRLELLVIELHDWLYPWQGTSDSFFRAIGRRHFDHLFRGENLFCFRRPQEGGNPGADA